MTRNLFTDLFTTVRRLILAFITRRNAKDFTKGVSRRGFVAAEQAAPYLAREKSGAIVMSRPRDFTPAVGYDLGVMLPSLRALLSFLVFTATLAVPVAARAEAAFVTRLSVPQNGVYNRSLVLRFTAEFSAPVVVVGAPRLPLGVGNQFRFATAITSLGNEPTTRVDFEYTPQPFDNAPDGIVVAGKIDPAGGAILGTDRSPANLSFAAPSANGIRVTALPAPTPQIQTAAPQPAAAGTFVISGTADGNSIVTITDEHSRVIGQVLAASNGAWRLACSTLDLAGSRHVAATAENTDGVPSARSDPVPISIPGV